uniref:Uncharacterized protein n=1 Tax=Cyanistes caeruleus TaxID=156563 RepID=A0A8C0VGY9_CYACU
MNPTKIQECSSSAYYLSVSLRDMSDNPVNNQKVKPADVFQVFHPISGVPVMVLAIFPWLDPSISVPLVLFEKKGKKINLQINPQTKLTS